MTAISTAAAIGGIIITIIVLVYVSQYRQRAQDARQREMNALNEKLRQFKMLATALPQHFIAPDIKVLLGQRAIETLKRLGDLDKPDNIQDQIVEWQTYQDNAKNNAQAASGKQHINPTAIKEIRHLLKVLYRFIESQMKRGRIEKGAGAQHLEQTLFLISKVLADAHVVKAKQVLKEGRFRIAIHHYHDALAAFNPIPNNPLAQKIILLYKQTIKDLEKQATAAQEAKNISAPPAANTQLGAELDQMMNKQDTWKKKQAYDD